MSPCIIDGNLVVGIVQALAILLTGGAAVFVANRQLKVYNATFADSVKARLMANSIKVVEDVYRPLAVSETPLSPSTAMDVLSNVRTNPDTLRRVQRAIQDSRDGRIPQNREELDRVRLALVCVRNYFDSVWDLIDRHLVDREFIVSRLCTLADHAYRNYIAIGALDDSDDTGFRDMALASYDFLRKSNPNLPPPPDA